eukprot:570392-Amphidinium_carterae.1
MPARNIEGYITTNPDTMAAGDQDGAAQIGPHTGWSSRATARLEQRRLEIPGFTDSGHHPLCASQKHLASQT